MAIQEFWTRPKNSRTLNDAANGIFSCEAAFEANEDFNGNPAMLFTWKMSGTATELCPPWKQGSCTFPVKSVKFLEATGSRKRAKPLFKKLADWSTHIPRNLAHQMRP